MNILSRLRSSYLESILQSIDQNKLFWSSMKGRAYLIVNPGDRGAWVALFESQRLAHNHRRAVKVCRAALSRFPNDDYFRSRLGFALLDWFDKSGSRQVFDEATSLFESELEERRESAPAMLGMAAVKARVDDFGAARELFAKAAEKLSPDAEPELFARLVGYAFVPGSGPQGIEIVKRAVLAWPDDAQLHALLSVLLEDGDEVGSRVHAERARALSKSEQSFQARVDDIRRWLAGDWLHQ